MLAVDADFTTDMLLSSSDCVCSILDRVTVAESTSFMIGAASDSESLSFFTDSAVEIAGSSNEAVLSIEEAGVVSDPTDMGTSSATDLSTVGLVEAAVRILFGSSREDVLIRALAADSGIAVCSEMISIVSTERAADDGTTVCAWPIERTACSAEVVFSVELVCAALASAIFAPPSLTLVSIVFLIVADDNNISPMLLLVELLVLFSTVVMVEPLNASVNDCDFVTLFSESICELVIVLCSAAVVRVSDKRSVVIVLVRVGEESVVLVSAEMSLSTVESVCMEESSVFVETSSSSTTNDDNTIDGRSILLEVEILCIIDVPLVVRSGSPIALVLLVELCVLVLTVVISALSEMLSLPGNDIASVSLTVGESIVNAASTKSRATKLLDVVATDSTDSVVSVDGSVAIVDEINSPG